MFGFESVIYFSKIWKEIAFEDVGSRVHENPRGNMIVQM
jgi:hypothetical protein